VPIQSLFWHLESLVSIDEFLGFLSVTKKQVIQLLELSNEMVNSPKIIQLYDTAA
jgi:hypothetical protein